MKKMFVLLGATLSVAACANNYECVDEYVEEPCPCQEQAPAQVYQPQYEYRPAPVAYVQQPAANCQGEVRTVREPVEVVYKRTTYGTVYEPRYFENVSYERQSVNGETYTQAGYAQPTVVEERATVTEQEYIVPTQAQAPAATPAPAPVAPARKYNGPVVIVPAQQ